MSKWVKREPDPAVLESVYGLTPLEEKFMDSLREAIGLFWEMDRQHPDEARYFTDAIHQIQHLMGQRALRRCHSKGWPTYKYVKEVGD